MHYIGFAELAAAVSDAGGLGVITWLTQRTPDLLAKEIAKCRALTDKPFGVDLTFLPSARPIRCWAGRTRSSTNGSPAREASRIARSRTARISSKKKNPKRSPP
jgi:NAD(P)H-dependent flavin oxidoreductase YrpB (nitropropane dioxygenase family)